MRCDRPILLFGKPKWDVFHTTLYSSIRSYASHFVSILSSGEFNLVQRNSAVFQTLKIFEIYLKTPGIQLKLLSKIYASLTFQEGIDSKIR